MLKRISGLQQVERQASFLATFRCSCSWTSCCLVSTSCFFWNSANNICFWSSCCCLRSTSSCCSCCSLMAVSTTATPPDRDPTLGSVRKSTGPPPPPPALSPGPPSINKKASGYSFKSTCVLCDCVWLFCSSIKYIVLITDIKFCIFESGQK